MNTEDWINTGILIVSVIANIIAVIAVVTTIKKNSKKESEMHEDRHKSTEKEVANVAGDLKTLKEVVETKLEAIKEDIGFIKEHLLKLVK